jgi:hypothetical protein
MKGLEMCLQRPLLLKPEVIHFPATISVTHDLGEVLHSSVTIPYLVVSCT